MPAVPGRRSGTDGLDELEVGANGLPYLGTIQRAFGRHDVTRIEAVFASSAAEMGAKAFAYGERVEFSGTPDLHTVAHEAAHVVQQRYGGSSMAGAGKRDDRHERHADEIADAVVAGQSAEALLDQRANANSAAVQVVQQKPQAPSVSARAYLQSHHKFTLEGEIKRAVKRIGMVARSPYGNKLPTEQFENKLLEVVSQNMMGGYGSVGGYFADGLQRFVAPESIEDMIDRARGHDWDLTDEKNPVQKSTGPASTTYISPVSLEITNAMARRYATAIQKLFPQFLRIYIDHKAFSEATNITVDTVRGGLVATHPMELAVSHALYATQKDIPLAELAATKPEIVAEYKAKYDAVGKTPGAREYAVDQPVDRPTSIEFKAKAGLFHWVEAIAVGEAGERTAAEVAKALFRSPAGSYVDSATAEAYRLIPVPPLWGFRSTDIRIFKPEHISTLRQELLTSYTTHAWPIDILDALGVMPMPFAVTPTDPIAELTADPQAALTRANASLQAHPLDGAKDAASVAAMLTENLKLLDVVTHSLNTIAHDLAAAESVRTRLSERFAAATSATACMTDVDAQYRLASQQNIVLSAVASGMTEAAVKWQQYSTEKTDDATGVCDPNVREMDPGLRKLLDEALDPFMTALHSIDFPEVAWTRLQLGKQRLSAFDISVQEASLHSAQTQIDDQLNADKTAPDVTGPKNKIKADELAFDLGAIRVQNTTAPLQAGESLGKKATEVGDFVFDVSLQDKLFRLDELWRWIDSEDDFWQGLGDKMKGETLKAQSKALRTMFNTTVKEPYAAAQKANDEAAKLRVREAFRTLLEELAPFAQEVQSFIKDTQRHKKWTKIIVGIVIAIVAFALGQYYFVGALAAGATALEAAVIGGIITTTTSMVLEKLILNHDPTLGSMIFGFLGNIGTFYVVGRMMMAARAAGVAAQVGEGTAVAAQAVAKGETVANVAKGAEAAAGAGAAAGNAGKFAKAAGALTLELIVGEVFMLLQAEGVMLIDEQRLLTWEEAKEAAAMGVVNIIGMKIGQHVFDTGVDAFKGMRAAKGVDIQGLINERQAIHDAGLALNQAAGGINKLKKGAPAPREQAHALIDRWNAYFKRERETIDKLVDLAAKHPEAFKAKAKELEALRDTAATDAAIMTQFRQTQALFGLEEVGPGLYRGDAPAFDALLSQHKAVGGELASVTTDPHTGQRTLTIKTKEGSAVEVIERLPDVGKREAPAVSVSSARFFEDWLAQLDRTTPHGAQVHQRLLEYYARDPQAAMRLAAERYDFTPGEKPTPELMVTPDAPTKTDAKPADATAADATPATPKQPAAAETASHDAARAFEHYEYMRQSEAAQGAAAKPAFKRGDFEAMYKAGFDFDPVKGEFVVRRTTAAGQVGAAKPELVGEGTHVLGEVHSEAVGHELLRKLVSGEPEALRVVGLEPPEGFDPRSSEWGLGKTADNKIVLIRGGKGEVNWSLLPGIEDIAHSHPFIDPITGKERRLKGENNSGVIDLNTLSPSSPNSVLMDLLYLMPSTGDLRFVALGNRAGHRVHTPYISLGEGKIGNPVDGGLHPTVEIVITKAEPWGLLAPESTIVVYKGVLAIYGADSTTPIKTIDIYQRYHDEASFKADWITLEPPQGAKQGLPPDHPITKFMQTPASTKPVAGLSPDAQRGLASHGLNLEQNTKLADRFGKLTNEQKATIEAMVLSDHLDGFASWIARVERKPAQLKSAVKDLEAARQALLDDSTLTITFDKEGVPAWEGKVATVPTKKGTTSTPDADIAAKNAAKLDRARDRAKAKLGVTLTGTDKWLGGMEAALDPKASTELFSSVALHVEDVHGFMAAADRLIYSPVVPAEARGVLLNYAAKNGAEGIKFLDDANANAQWLASRQLSPEARAGLLRRTTQTLDFAWLKQQKLTDVELEHLGARDYIPWNQFKALAEAKANGTLSTSEAINASKASHPHIRGVAGEIAARDPNLALKHGNVEFKIEGTGSKAADGLEPDYSLISSDGTMRGDLEVKANALADMRGMLDAVDALKGRPLADYRSYKLGPELEAQLSKAQRLVNQIKGSKARDRIAFLAISTEINTRTHERLRRFLLTNDAMPHEIVKIDKAAIDAAAQSMRDNMGLPKPFETSPPLTTPQPTP